MKVLAILAIMAVAMLTNVGTANAEVSAPRLEARYIDWKGDTGTWTFQFIRPNGTRFWASGNLTERRTGLSGQFDNGERVVAETITIGGKVWRGCIFWDAPGDGSWSDGGAVNPWQEEQQKAASRKVCDPNAPDATASQAATPTQPAPGDKPGLCQIGRDSWGPAILEGSVDNRPAVIRLSLGQQFVLQQGGCWTFPSNDALGAAWGNHKNAFVSRYGASANVIER